MNLNLPSERLIARKDAIELWEKNDLIDDEDVWKGSPPMIATTDLSVSELVFISKNKGSTPRERLRLLISYGIMCDHPSGHRFYNRTRRWFKCDVCETTCISVPPVIPSPNAPYTPGAPTAISPISIAA